MNGNGGSCVESWGWPTRRGEKTKDQRYANRSTVNKTPEEAFDAINNLASSGPPRKIGYACQSRDVELSSILGARY